MDFVFFHNPDQENAYLSNWFYCDFVVDGIKFHSGEQYMMYSKAVVMGDKQTASKILAERDFRKIKNLGRRIKPFDASLWNKEKEYVMVKGLTAKFEQNEELKEQLLATGDAILAECAQKDLIWGIGLRMNSKDRFFPEKWKGQNKLGKVLMKVRHTLSGNKELPDKMEFALRDYCKVVEAKYAEIDSIGNYLVDCDFHFEYYSKPFRVYIPEADCTFRETYSLEPGEKLYDGEPGVLQEYRVFNGDNDDPFDWECMFFGINEILEAIAYHSHISVEELLDYKCCLYFEKD